MRRALAFALVLRLGGAADANVCRSASVDFLPAEQPTEPGLQFPLQIVAWLEDARGVFVDTMFITLATGTFGLGNRPGRFDFNSAPHWPYGRRITTFPVWAHRHGLSFPEVVFQSGNEDDLSGGAAHFASLEHAYCRPMQRTEPAWDLGSCASSIIYTDKGMFAPGGTSLYPPRNDVDQYEALNPFDVVSQATPPSGVPASFIWTAPTLPDGDYVLFVEVAREFDSNASYDFPAPTGIPFAGYGLPYRGQPSVVYRVPIALAPGDTVATALDYVGYGDPDGLDGAIRAPDATITTGVPGSGAGRLAITSDGYRVRIAVHTENDTLAPAAPVGLATLEVGETTARFVFTAPGDDGVAGKRIARYEARLLAGDDITEDNFAGAPLLLSPVPVANPGGATTLDLAGLLPGTPYSLGIRAVDDCGNVGPIATIAFETPGRSQSRVDACFIATAAYGSAMAADLAPLRRFRDAVLRRSALGELAVEGYYTFGPAVAQAIGESDLLRATARRLLAPVVRAARSVRL